jgi:hypothetical protein
LVTADYDLVPDDEAGYRAALIEAFRSRGIVPEGVRSYSEESLIWCPPEVAHDKPLPNCTGLQFDVFQGTDNQFRKEQQVNNAKVLHQFAIDNAEALGLILDEGSPISARTFHEVHRVGPDGKVNFDMVAELTQNRKVPVNPEDPISGTFTFRGGTTLIVNRDGDVRYSIQKSMGDAKNDNTNERLKRQREYQSLLEANMAFATYSQSGALRGTPMSFDFIHRGY